MESVLDKLSSTLYIRGMLLSLPRRTRILAWSCVGLAAVAFATGALLQLFGVSFVPDVPVTAPFWTTARFGLLVGLLLLALARAPIQDEFIDRLRLEAFRVALVAVAAVVIVNESIYFFADRVLLDGAGVVLVVLVVYHATLALRLRSIGREARP